MPMNDAGGTTRHKTCPTCGRDDFASRRGMKFHHVLVPDERLTVTCICEHCDGEYEVREPKVEDTRFCSRTCQNKWRTGKRHGRYKGGPAILTCERCGTEYEYQRSLTENSRFCSYECLNEWKSSRPPEEHPSWKGGLVPVNCEICEETYEVKPHLEDEARFCSTDCWATWLSEQRKGQAFFEGDVDSGGLYQPLIRSISEQSWPVIRNQELHDQCVICGHIGDLELHHLIPVLGGGTNEPWNLITLCAECHYRTERHTKAQLAAYIPRIEKTGRVVKPTQAGTH